MKAAGSAPVAACQRSAEIIQHAMHFLIANFNFVNIFIGGI
jgi:hypothetical protein